ncbi:MAG: Flp pilus assembly complex ATPase component TadA [Clostridia bacterium]|nr:Flp pilus assembly complex ATPase component TadA [Clostridia bacterium]
MLSRLLSVRIYNELFAEGDMPCLTEIRLRADKPLSYAQKGVYHRLQDVIVSMDDIAYTLGIASQHSMYAVNDSLSKGYLTCGEGYRIGVCGEGVIKNGALFTVKNITSLCIRVPHEVKGCCDKIVRLIEKAGNTLIVSPPGLGKTTMLRECVRLLSMAGHNVLVLDERGEIAPVSGGSCHVDIGDCCDVASGIPKIDAYRYLVRSMRPDIIATDEIFGKAEVDAVLDIVRCGVKVVATVHASGIEDIFKSEEYRGLGKLIDYYVVLRDIGEIGAIYDRTELKTCGR